MSDMQETFRKGDRVKLVHIEDEYTNIKCGTEGTVLHVDSRGTVHVKWDDGRTLGICLDVGDDLELISQGGE